MSAWRFAVEKLALCGRWALDCLGERDPGPSGRRHGRRRLSDNELITEANNLFFHDRPELLTVDVDQVVVIHASGREDSGGCVGVRLTEDDAWVAGWWSPDRPFVAFLRGPIISGDWWDH